MKIARNFILTKKPIVQFLIQLDCNLDIARHCAAVRNNDEEKFGCTTA